MKTALITYIACILLSVLMQAVEEQQERFKNDSNRSPKERNRAYHRYEFARTVRKTLPILCSVYLVIYIILHIL